MSLAIKVHLDERFRLVNKTNNPCSLGDHLFDFYVDDWLMYHLPVPQNFEFFTSTYTEMSLTKEFLNSFQTFGVHRDF